MKPRRPRSTVYPLRIPDPLLAKVAKVAEEEKRTSAYIIREFIEDGLERRA